MIHYAESWCAREKLERELHGLVLTHSGGVELGRDAPVSVAIQQADIKRCGSQYARFELRGDPHLIDADYVTCDRGPVIRLEPGLSDAAVEAVFRAWFAGRDEGIAEGRRELRREFNALLEE